MNRAGRTVYPILLMVCATHLLNDMMQSVIPAVYPLLKEKFGFTFAQIGLITLVFQLTSSLLQPVAGRLADLHPRPYSLAAGMCFTLCGLLALAAAPGFALILVSVGLIGCGSSVFHPESSRVAQLASGGRKGPAGPPLRRIPRGPDSRNVKFGMRSLSWAYWSSRSISTSPR